MEHAQLPRVEVGPASVGVDQATPFERDRQRVEREVAPCQVGLDRRAERHLGQGAGGSVCLGARRGDVDLELADADRRRAEALVLEDFRAEPIGERGGVALDDEIEVGRTAPAEQQVADRAADQVDGILGSRPDRLQLRVGVAHGFGEVVVRDRFHFGRPGCLP